MSKQPPLAARIEAWTREALETWGDDWELVCAHIERRMTSLLPDEKRGLADEALLTLVGADECVKH